MFTYISKTRPFAWYQEVICISLVSLETYNLFQERVTEELPPLRELRLSSLENAALDLLYWTLNPKQFSLHSCKKEKVGSKGKYTSFMIIK